MGSTSKIEFTLKKKDFLDSYDNAMQCYDVENLKAIEDYIDTSTPIREKKGKLDITEDIDTVNPDLTPFKNLATKRRSLMLAMTAQSDKEQETAKHPMAMRSRKRVKEPYYHYQEYVDFGEDLSFLFDEQLPELQPRKYKSRRKKPTQETKKTPEKNKETNVNPTSKYLQFNLKDATQTTSKNFSTNFETRPNKSREKICPLSLDSDLTICNNNLTSDPTGTCPKNSEKDKSKSRKRSNPFPNNEKKIDKRHKMHLSLERSKMRDANERFRSRYNTKTQRLKEANREHASVNACLKDGQQYNNVAYVVRKLDPYSKLHSLACSKNQMTLRRNSTSALFHQKSPNKVLIRRTVSTPCAQTLEISKKSQPRVADSPQTPKVDEGDSCEYSEEFVDSPDSGFGSEASCSAASPSSDPLGGFFDVASRSGNEDSTFLQERGCGKDPISRTNSSDSGVGTVSPDNKSLSSDAGNDEICFLISQETIRKNLKLEQEEKKRKVDEELRERFQCRWLNCKSAFKSRSVTDLHEHVSKCHVQKMKADRYCCRWQGCKMFEKFSRKLSWLERHVGEHSGENHFKCILGGCDASFKTLPCLKRHVEAHYTEVSLPKARVGGEHGPLSRFMLNSRRIQDKRKTLANRLDCMDRCTLGYIKGALIHEEVAVAAELLGQPDLVFTPQVIGRKKEKNGSKLLLVKWQPENILPDQWIPACKLETEKKIRKAMLPWRAKESLKEIIFFSQNLNRRKPRIVSNQTLFRGMFEGN